MKKVYLILILFVIAFPNTINAQATIINDNHSLSGYPIFGNSIFLTSDVDSTLWTSDGTPGGTKQYAFNVKADMDRGAGLLNNKIYFAGIDALHGSELWVTDGTAGGTKLVQDLISGSKSSSPRDFFPFKNNLYFTDSTTVGRELYVIKSDGSVSLFKDINQVSGKGNAFSDDDPGFFSNNNLMYFIADDGIHGKELWVSDGTSSNTHILKDISPNADSTSFGQFSQLGNLVIFAVNTSQSVFSRTWDLWKTDGTTTTKIQSFNGFGTFGFLTFNNKIYFDGSDATNGTELWSTDGTHTSLVKDIYPGNIEGNPNSSYPQLFNSVFIKGKFLFSATDGAGAELWSSDGTPENTLKIMDINPGSESSNPEIFPVFDYSKILTGNVSLFDFFQRGTLFNGSIFFSADDGTNGTQLWKTDGTSKGTVMVQSIGGQNGGISSSYFYTKTGLYFSANDGTNGEEPWFSNGSTVQMVADINKGAKSSYPEFLFVYNNNLFINADNGNTISDTVDLYRIDATVSPLPIQLLDFKANLQSEAVQLTWKTATEINSKNFVIQRSINGVQFSDIGTVAAAGNSTSEKSYIYNDDQYLEAGSNVLYYRLQLNDEDGKTNYSQVQIVKLDAPSILLKTYPNPVHNQLSVLFGSASSKTAILKISDLNGKELYRQNFGVTQFSRLQNINVSGFAKGTYFVQLITDKENKITKFVKQ